MGWSLWAGGWSSRDARFRIRSGTWSDGPRASNGRQQGLVCAELSWQAYISSASAAALWPCGSKGHYLCSVLFAACALVACCMSQQGIGFRWIVSAPPSRWAYRMLGERCALESGHSADRKLHLKNSRKLLQTLKPYCKNVNRHSREDPNLCLNASAEL